MTIRTQLTFTPEELAALAQLDYAALERMFWIQVALHYNVPPSLILDFGAHFDVSELAREAALQQLSKWPERRQS